MKTTRSPDSIGVLCEGVAGEPDLPLHRLVLLRHLLPLGTGGGLMGRLLRLCRTVAGDAGDDLLPLHDQLRLLVIQVVGGDVAVVVVLVRLPLGGVLLRQFAGGEDAVDVAAVTPDRVDDRAHTSTPGQSPFNT